MKLIKNILTLAILIHLFGANIVANTLTLAPEPTKKQKQTNWHLYLTAQQAYTMKTNNPKHVLFLDVRDPSELLFTGNTNIIDFNIPFKILNPNEWADGKKRFSFKINQNFEQNIQKALKLKNMSKQDHIIIMCRSGGTRGAPATKLLENKGYKNVWVVVDGFEGSKTKQGKYKGFRLQNGWKNGKNLPWGYKSMDKTKMYFYNFK